MKHKKVLIIAKYADDGAREAMSRTYSSFHYNENVCGTYSANECGINVSHYKLEDRAVAEADLNRLIRFNPTVGYGIVEVEYPYSNTNEDLNAKS